MKAVTFSYATVFSVRERGVDGTVEFCMFLVSRERERELSLLNFVCVFVSRERERVEIVEFVCFLYQERERELVECLCGLCTCKLCRRSVDGMVNYTTCCCMSFERITSDVYVTVEQRECKAFCVVRLV